VVALKIRDLYEGSALQFASDNGYLNNASATPYTRYLINENISLKLVFSIEKWWPFNWPFGCPKVRVCKRHFSDCTIIGCMERCGTDKELFDVIRNASSCLPHDLIVRLSILTWSRVFLVLVFHFRFIFCHKFQSSTRFMR